VSFWIALRARLGAIGGGRRENHRGRARERVQRGRIRRERIQRAIGTALEPLESRILLSWTGATSGSTNDAAHNYNNTANWSGGTINDSFAGATFSANTTIYLSAARTTASTGLNVGYSGNFNLTIESSSSTAETLTINGGIKDSVGGTRTITLGNATNPLNLSLDSATQTLSVAAGDKLAILGVVSSGGISNSGAGTTVLSGANTYASGTTLSAGVLDINSATAIGTGAFTISGGSIDNTSGAAITDSNNNAETWGGNFTFVGSNALNLGSGAVTLSAARTVTTTAGLLTVGGIISGAFGLTKAGAGTLTLSGANTYTGGMTLSAGQIDINNAKAIGTGTFAISGGTIDNTSGAAITLSNNNVETWGGNFTFVGSNALNLGTGAVAISAARTLTTTGGTLTVGGVISGAFALTTAGAGTLIFAGANTFTGGATIGAGKLLANNTAGSATGTGTVTVSSGGTLGGSGSVSGAVNVGSGGTLVPGSGSGTGILSTGALTLSSGASLSSVVNGTTLGTGYDQVNVTGNATVTGSTLSLSGTSVTHDGSQLTIVKVSGTEAGTFSGLAQGGTISSNGVVYTASYVGGTGHSIVLTANPAASSTVVTSSANPGLFGQSITFTATVSSSGSGTPTGTVTFKDGSTTLGMGGLNGSAQATFSTSSLSVARHSITAVYGGDTNFTGSTSSALSEIENQDGTTTTIASGANPLVFGQSVTFTATVAAASPGAGVATGSVTFKDGAVTLGSAALNGSDQATLTLSGFTVASHSITAVYGGDSHFIGSSSSALSETVNRDSTATSVSGSNPVIAGQTETLTATVMANSPGGGAPTGTVSFLDGSTTLGTGTLNGSGQATFSTSALLAGSHSITAVYAGDGNFAGSGSTALSLTVAQNGTGLLGEYFSGMNLTTPDLFRIDPTVNFNWNNNSPDPSLAMTGYSVKWTGTVEALYSETYTFYTTSDDGARLWVNGQELINQWHDQGPTEYSGTIALVAGQQYSIEMDYYQDGGGAVATLSWSSASQGKEIIPAAQLYAPSGSPPDAPTNLSVTAGLGSANLTWSSDSSGTSSFIIERKAGASGTYAPVATVPIGATNFSDNHLSPSTQYFYTVEALGAGGASGSSNAVSVTPTAQSLPFSDTFDRANGGLGSNWFIQQGSFSISSDEAVNSQSDSLATVNGISDPDVSVSAYMDISNGGSNASAGLITRMTSNGYYYGRIRISFNVQVYAEILYYSAVTNSWTTLVSNGISASSKGTIQFDTSGDSLALFYNGQSVAAVQDASLGGPGGAGVYAESNDTGYSNFEVNAEPSSSASAGLPFSDTFARGTGAFIGSDWTVNAGDFDLNDNLLVAAVSNSNSLVVVNGASTADAEVSAVVDVTNAAPFGWGGVAARVSGTNGYVGRLIRNYNDYSVELGVFNNGQYTSLSSTGVNASSGTVQLEVVGSSINLYFDGALMVSAVDTSISGAGGVGIYSGGDEGVTFSDFSASAAVAPTPANATLPFSDDFNRADSTFVGSYWTEETGNVALANDQVVQVGMGTSSVALNGISAADVILSADVNAANGYIWGSSVGLDARVTGTSEYRGQIRRYGSSYFAEILRDDNGVWTTLDSRIAIGSGTLRFEVRGSSLALYLNGVPVAMASDSTYDNAGGVGVDLNGGSWAQSVSFGSFSAAVATAPPAPQNASLPFSDNFNRADNSVVSANWTTQEGSMAVGQDQLMTLDSAETLAVLNGISSANVSIVADMNMTLGGNTVGLDARVSGNSRYRGQITDDDGTYLAQILSEVNGSWTTLDSRAVTWPLVNGRPSGVGLGTIRFDLDGAQLGLYLNNELVAAAGDTSITAAGTVGIYTNGTIGLDNFGASALSPGAAANTSLTFDDGFSRADNAITLGANWVEQVGDIAVWNGAAADMGLGTSVATLQGVSDADEIVGGQVNVPAGQTIGLVARYSGPGAGEYYFGTLSGSGAAEIGLSVDGSVTSLASGTAPANSGSLRFEVVGDQLQLFLNNALLISATNSTLSGAGSVGVIGTHTTASGNTDATLGSFDARLPLSIQDAVLAIPTSSSAVVEYWEPGVALTHILTGDFNGDGKTDVAGFDPATGNWMVGLSNGASGFTTQTWATWSAATDWTNIVVGDFNGDGLTDIAARNAATGMWSVAISNGSSFTTTTWGSWNSGDTYQNVVVGDFNGDGRDDIAGWDETAGTWIVANSNGVSFATTTWGSGTAGASWEAVVAGDFNGDGRDDLAALNGSTGAWNVELSAGNHFTGSIWGTWNSSVAWTNVQAADFNGDGLADLVGTSAESSSWQVALSTGSGFNSQSWGTQAGNLTDEQIGDFNGDGKADIAGNVAGTNQWRIETSTETGFTDQYWLTTSAAEDIQAVLAGNTLALNRAAAQDFETVYNNIQYQPYAGEMKGPEATQETGEGNDWDQDALLIQLLSQSGIQAQYVSGQISVPTAEVLNWLGAVDTSGAVGILTAADLNPTVVNSGLSNEAIEFNHTWVEALLPGLTGLQWRPMDPSFKFQNSQMGIGGLSALVPFNQTNYLAHVTSESPVEYYESQVAGYLAANDPGQSLADVPSDGPIVAQKFNVIPSALPYSVVGTPTTYTSVPEIMTDRVELVLQDLLFGGVWETPLDYTVSVPSVALDTIAITYTQAADGNYMPELRIDGQIVQASSSEYVVGGDTMQLLVEHYLPGSSTVSSTSSYDRNPGITMAIGLDADQFSNASVEALQTRLNGESLAVENGETSQTQAAFDDGLSLAVEEYFEKNDQEADIIAGLNHVKVVHGGVGDGILDSDPSQIAYNWGADVPIASLATGFDIVGNAPGGVLATNGTDGQYGDRLTTLELMAFEGSFLESSVLATVFNADSLSAVSAIQWANDNGDPVLTIDSANESQMISELTIPQSQVSLVQGFVNQGDTVIVPENEITLGAWSGTAMILQQIQAHSFFQGDAVVGSYVTHGSVILNWIVTHVPPFNPNQTHAGDPVDTATGAFTRADTDVSIPNVGMPLTFARQYISNSQADIGLGQGWTDTYGDTMTTLAGGDVLWTDSQGDQYTFTPNGSGGYVAPAGLFGTLTSGSGGFVYADKYGNVRSFNSAGRLAEIEDANGNSLIISYDSEGNLASVKDGADASRELTFASANGHITSVSDFTDRTWTFSYEMAISPTTGQTIYLLASRTSPSDATTPAEILTYGYALTGALAGLLTSISDSSDGKSIQINYYPNGQAFSVTDPVGNTEYFFYDQSHNETTYINALGQAQVDEFNAQGLTVKQINPDQTFVTSVWSDGLLQSQTDAMGRMATYQYDSSGNLTQYVAPDGIETDTQYSSTFNLPTEVTVVGTATTLFTYDSHGDVTSITDAMGDKTTMTYYADGLIETLTAPNGNVVDPHGDYATTYTYNEAGQVLTAVTGLPSTVTNTYDNRGDLTSTTDGDGRTTAYAYDVLGRVITTTGPDPDGSGPETSAVSSESYDPAADEVTATDPLGNQTSTFTDGNDRVVKVVNADGTFTTNTYDAVGNLVDSTDERGETTQYVYDSENRLIQTLLPDGASISTAYNADRQVVSSTDADGNTTGYAYNAGGQLASVTNPLGQVTSYVYDDLGNVATVTDPNGTTTFTHDLVGRVTQTRSPGNVVTTTDYDADGNVVNQTLYDVSGLSPIPSDPRTLAASRKESTVTAYDVLDRPIEVTDPAGDHSYTAYNADGQVISTTDAGGAITTYGYDGAGRLVSETSPNPDGVGSVTTTDTYDADDDLISQTDGLGNTTTNAYNDLDEMVSQTQPDPDGSGPLSAPATTFQYNVDGEQTSETDADGNVTFSTYDSVGRQATQVNTLGAKSTYQYDGNGNLVSTTDADGRTTDYVYDALNRVTAENWIGANGSTVIYSIQYTYNDQDQLATVSDPDGSYTYSYNAAGQVSSVDNTGTPNVPHVVLSQSYDGFGNRSSLSASVGGTTEFTNSYQYNALGEMTQETQSGAGVSNKEVTFAYNALGELTGIDRYASTNGASAVASTVYGYNSANQLTSLTHTNSGTGTTIAGYGITYNANGEIVTETSGDGTANYAYDDDGELTGASGSALPTSQAYSYDAGGNRTNAGDSTSTNNELTSDGTYNYRYDADGNLIQQTNISSGATINYTWDYRNRLTDVTYKTSGGTTTEHVHYTYHPLNRRISQSIDSNGDGTYDSVENYVYDGSNLLMVVNGSGNVTHTFLNGPAANQVIADDAGGGNVTWMLTDQQGSVRDVVNNSGTVIDHIEYDSYGNILSQTSSVNQPGFAYAGMQLDRATGLYYDNARYYDSGTGEFISQDPLGFGGGNTNLHGYVNNDPVNLVDPSGLSPKGGAGGGGTGGSGSGNGNGGPGGPTAAPGGYRYGDELKNSWFFNFVSVLYSSNPTQFGSASEVTTPQSVRTAQKVVAATGVVLATGGAAIAAAPAVIAAASTFVSYAQLLLGAGGVLTGIIKTAAQNPGLVQEGEDVLNEVTPTLTEDTAAADESAQSIISNVGQQQANKGAAQLLAEGSMTQGQYTAYSANPEAGSRFLGTAVHNATNTALQNAYPGRFIYNTVGPDFLDTTTGQFVDLTTPGQVAAHVAKGEAYAAAKYATYVVP
jgi:RHS repeat-associated protein